MFVNVFTRSPRFQRHVSRISESAVRRLSLYLRTLQEAHDGGVVTLSSDELARRGGTTSAQVRKDLSLFGSFGKRGLGYSVDELRRQLEEILGLSHSWKVALVGAGKIGAALFSYADFRRKGFVIRSVYDADPAKVGTSWGKLTVRAAAELEDGLRADRTELVIIAVPATAAQQVIERVARAGVRGVLNFAPVRLRAPEWMSVRSVDMSVELEALSYALSQRDRQRMAG